LETILTVHFATRNMLCILNGTFWGKTGHKQDNDTTSPSALFVFVLVLLLVLGIWGCRTFCGIRFWQVDFTYLQITCVQPSHTYIQTAL